MKKILHVLVWLGIGAGAAFAQVPQFFNTNAAGGANTFPFANAATSRKVTWFIPANSLGAVTAGNMITHVYFQLGSTTTRTYPIFNIKLKVGSGTGLTGTAGGPCETGLTTVYTATNLTINSVAGQWYQFALSSPWNYNPNLPLIVEVEHNSTTAGGSTVYQAANIPGPGNGRQWADYQAINNTGVGMNQVNFGIDVIPAVPCAGTPPPNSVASPTAPICPYAATQIGLSTTYTLGGLNYFWEYSNLSAVGPWTPVPNGTTAVITTPTINATHYFRSTITCTNSSSSVIAASGSVNVQAITTNTAPYFEGFEGIAQPNKLPNCSWNISNQTTCQTYTSVQNQNRSPRTGQKYAAFYSIPASNNMFWTNEIWLEPGVTYSAAMWYKTEFNTNPVFDLKMWLSGAGQTTVGANILATTGGPGSAAAPSYVPLSNTFVVTSAGYYNVGINANSNGSSTMYMSWDDLSITAPCDLNPVGLTLSANSTSACAGQPVSLIASGADSYLWNNGSTSSSITFTPYGSIMYSVVGTNAITGCTAAINQQIDVYPSPVVAAIANDPAICRGSSTMLNGLGADTYAWSNSATGPVIVVSPTVSTTYTVIGTNANGCTGQGVIFLQVNPLPVLSIFSSNANNLACREDMTELSAIGAQNYTWTSISSYQVGNPVNVSPNSTTTFSLVGSDQNGCKGTASYQLSVMDCVGINESTGNLSGIQVYPNPNAGDFVLRNEGKLDLNIEISDLSGRVIYSHKGAEENLPISLGNAAAGLYQITVKAQSGTQVIKMVKH